MNNTLNIKRILNYINCFIKFIILFILTFIYLLILILLPFIIIILKDNINNLINNKSNTNLSYINVIIIIINNKIIKTINNVIVIVFSDINILNNIIQEIIYFNFSYYKIDNLKKYINLFEILINQHNNKNFLDYEYDELLLESEIINSFTTLEEKNVLIYLNSLLSKLDYFDNYCFEHYNILMKIIVNISSYLKNNKHILICNLYVNIIEKLDINIDSITININKKFRNFTFLMKYYKHYLINDIIKTEIFNINLNRIKIILKNNKLEYFNSFEIIFNYYNIINQLKIKDKPIDFIFLSKKIIESCKTLEEKKYLKIYLNLLLSDIYKLKLEFIEHSNILIEINYLEFLLTYCKQILINELVIFRLNECLSKLNYPIIKIKYMYNKLKIEKFTENSLIFINDLSYLNEIITFTCNQKLILTIMDFIKFKIFNHKLYFNHNKRHILINIINLNNIYDINKKYDESYNKLIDKIYYLPILLAKHIYYLKTDLFKLNFIFNITSYNNIYSILSNKKNNLDLNNLSIYTNNNLSIYNNKLLFYTNNNLSTCIYNDKFKIYKKNILLCLYLKKCSRDVIIYITSYIGINISLLKINFFDINDFLSVSL